MLFRRKMDPRCCYCKHGGQINEREVACLKRGVVPAEYHCHSFCYDPLRRVPPRPLGLDVSGLEEKDFSL